MADCTSLQRLIAGYRAFREGAWEQNRARYRMLAEHGQAPGVMVIGCCDSRVDPSLLFGAGPGELFIVRNVANLVPPFEPHGDYHGTSAALEFAVTCLGVGHVIVLGHTHCGGIKALREGLAEAGETGDFIARWMSIMNPARAAVLDAHPGAPEETVQRALEEASIRNSLANLETFPFVRERLRDGRLQIHGWQFDITSGELRGLDREHNAFVPLG